MTDPVLKKFFELRETYDSVFLELAEVLWTIKEKQKYRLLGCQSFGEFVATKSGMSDTTVYYLLTMYQRLFVTNKNVVSKKLLVDSGWTKVSMVSRLKWLPVKSIPKVLKDVSKHSARETRDYLDQLAPKAFKRKTRPTFNRISFVVTPEEKSEATDIITDLKKTLGVQDNGRLFMQLLREYQKSSGDWLETGVL